MDINELKKIKLEAEIEHIQSLTKQQQEGDKTSEKKWVEKFNKWNRIIITFISLIAAIWGVILPISNYFEEKNKAKSFELNNHMINLIDELDSSDHTKVDRAILLLSYYEKNSLPILFYKLQRVKYSSNKILIENISQTISNVYKTDDKEVVKMLNELISFEMDKLFGSKTIDDYNLYAIINLIYVVDKLPLGRKDKNDFEKLLNDFEKDLINFDPNKEKVSSVFTIIEECKNSFQNN